MICKHCNNEIPDGALFCVKCGKKLEASGSAAVKTEETIPVFCADCGAALKPGAKFCTKCGKKVEAVVRVSMDTVLTGERKNTPEIEPRVTEVSQPKEETQLKEASQPEKETQLKEALQPEEETQLKEASQPEEETQPKTVQNVLGEKTLDKGSVNCRICGNPLKPTAKFCAKCGSPVNHSGILSEQTTTVTDTDGKLGKSDKPAKTENVGTMENTGQPPKEISQPKMEFEEEVYVVNEAPKTPKRNIMVIILVLVTVIVLAVAGIMAVKFLDSGISGSEPVTTQEGNNSENNSEADTQILQTPTSEEAASEDPLAGVNHDLTAGTPITLTGTVAAVEDYWVLHWDAGLSFGEMNAAGEPMRMDNVTDAVIDKEPLPENFLTAMPEKGAVNITGVFHIIDNQLHVTPAGITDTAGADLITAFMEAAAKEYILPQSDTVLLTEEDLTDLTLQQINYAKNEIYARHGRKFSSPELQKYFNSKSWYKGTIDAKKFDKNTGKYLSDIENKNAALLSEVEKKLGTYQLDQ